MLLRRSFVQQGGRTGAYRPNWMEQSGMKHAGLLFHAAAHRHTKNRRSCRVAARLSKNLVAFAPAGAKKVQSFSSATCAAKKILLRLQVWNLCAGGAQIMRAADCTPLVKKPPLRSERRLWRISVRSIGVRLHRAAHERQQRRQQQRKHDRLRRADAQTQRQRAEDEHGRIVPVDEAVDIQ